VEPDADLIEELKKEHPMTSIGMSDEVKEDKKRSVMTFGEWKDPDTGRRFVPLCIESAVPVPNIWYRFWGRVLINVRWKKALPVDDSV